MRSVIASLGKSLAVACALAVLPSVGAHAQTSTGTIRGFVTSAGGTPVAGATIVARDVERGTVRNTTSSDNGFYNLPGLRPAQYELTVRRIGLAPQTRNVRVQIGQTLTADFTLQEAATQLEQVTVVAAPEVETRTSEVASNVTREQIENLPLIDRNFLDLAQLAPGVRAERPGDNNKTFASGALGAEQVNVFVDGASYKNDVLLGGVAGQDASQGNPFPQNAVQEFRIITQNYKAEYQKAASAIITATTRSGTNTWEGSAFAYGVGKGYVAKSGVQALEALPSPNFQRLQAGASLGGPITRDKLFLFGSYELNFRDQPADVFLGGDASRAPAALISRLQPFLGRSTEEFREHLAFGKLTFVPTDRHTVDASLNYRREEDIRGFGGQTTFQAAENVKNDVYTGVANWRYSRDRWLNEAQVSGQYYRWNPTPLNPGEIGQNYLGILRVGGKDTRQEFTQTRLSFRNDVTFSGARLAGEHVFKGGASLDFLGYDVIKDFNTNPVFEYRVDENYARPFQAFFGFGDPQMEARNTQFGAYVQDDWTVTPKLVLNLGLRWDVETNMANNDYVTPPQLIDSLTGPLRSKLLPVVQEQGGIENYFTDGNDRPPFYGAFQPRLGASYDVFGDQRTVLFAGGGIYYDRDFWNIMIDERFRRQFSVLRIEFNDVGPTAECPNCVQWQDQYLSREALRGLAESGQAGAPEVFLVRNDHKPPKSYQFSGGIRQTVGPLQVSAAYTGVRGFNGMAFVFGAPCCNQLLPNYSNLLISTNDVESWYNALLLKIEKPIGASRWGGAVSYTLGKAEQRGEYFFSLDDRYGQPKNYPRQPSRPIFSGISSDQRHTVVANGIARLPYDFQFSTVVTLGSGYPVFGEDQRLGSDPSDRRTIIYYPPTKPFLGIGHVFATQNVDMRLAKGFDVVGGQRVALQVDVFNVFNSRNFGNFETFLGRPGPGQTPNDITNPRFGRPTEAAEGRRLQVGLRYDFAATGGQ